MKEEKKKLKSNKIEEDYFRYIEELSHLVIEGMREQRIESLEPFEVYAERIKSKLYADLDQSSIKFMKGYQMLLEELTKPASGA